MSATVLRQVTKSQAFGPRPSVFGKWVRRFKAWRRSQRERGTLNQMDQRDLNDLGLSRWDIEREIARHLWEI